MEKNLSGRCVVTGLGLITAIGNNVEECWENALAGKSGIDKVKSVSSENCYADLGAEVDCGSLDEAKYADDMDRASKLCVKSAGEALKDSGLVSSEANSGRLGVIMGSCVGGVVSIENFVKNGEKAEVYSDWARLYETAVTPYIHNVLTNTETPKHAHH